MQVTAPYYLLKLREGLSLKQRTNPQYSLRAYARDIGIHPATLSQIINGKRALPFKDSEIVSKKLNLGPKEASLFKESLLPQGNHEFSSSDDKKVLLEESHYKIIAEWEHYALLELFNLSCFKANLEEIAKKLDLTPTRAKVVVDNLLVAGLIVQCADGTYSKVFDDVKTTEDIKSQALRDSHIETLEMGKTKLDLDIHIRDFSSSTVAIRMSKIPEAKKIIREFRKKIIALSQEESGEEIFQLAVQFYPLTKIAHKEVAGDVCVLQ